MAKYRISGVWKDNSGVITHYAFHEVGEKSTSRAKKMSKSDSVTLLSSSSNEAYTWMWNYKEAGWTKGEKVTVVDGQNGKYLRSNPDNKHTDNLAHLINYNWISQ